MTPAGAQPWNGPPGRRFTVLSRARPDHRTSYFQVNRGVSRCRPASGAVDMANCSANGYGRPMLLDAQRSALVVVDVQERLAPAMDGGAAVEARCSVLMRAAARLDVPVVVSEQYPKGLGPTVPALAALTPPGAVIAKTAFSCMGEPAFAARISALGRDQFIVCGIEAHVCVLQTALALAAAGQQVAVVEDAVGSRRPSDKAAALRRLDRAGVTIVTSEMAVFEWLGRAGTPAFKDLSALIR